MNKIQQIGGTLALGAAALLAGAGAARYTVDSLKQEVGKVADEAAHIAVNAGTEVVSEVIGKTVVEVGSEYYKRRLMLELLPPEELKKITEELKHRLEQRLKQKSEQNQKPDPKPEKSPSRLRIKRPSSTTA